LELLRVCGNIPPAQAMRRIIPFKDWRDVVRDKEIALKTEYKVTPHERKSYGRVLS
jgi:hypothetical protein